MVPSERTQNILIAILAVLAISTSALAVWSVNRPVPSATGEGTIPPATSLAPSTGSSATAAPPDDAAMTTGEPTTTPSGDPQSAWLAAWSDEADLLVVGDGFSNMPDQWLQLWADLVGQDRPVTIHHWGEAADVSFNDPIVLSDSDGPLLTVWSGSRSGSSIVAAVEHYDRFIDASTTPDAVLVSLGLSSGSEDVEAGMDALLERIDSHDDEVPVLVAIAPGGHYEQGVADALLSWAQEHDDRVAVVDLRGEAPDQASAEQWAVALERALGGS